MISKSYSSALVAVRASPPLQEEANSGSEFHSLLVMILTHPVWSNSKHLAGDILPYTCVFEECPTPGAFYLTREAWVSHMGQEHGGTERWICQACSQKGVYVTFHTPVDFTDHLQQQHSKAIKPHHFPTLLSAWRRKLPFKIPACPLCDFQNEDQQALLDHTAEHVHSFSLRSLPWAPREGVDEDDKEQYGTYFKTNPYFASCRSEPSSLSSALSSPVTNTGSSTAFGSDEAFHEQQHPMIERSLHLLPGDLDEKLDINDWLKRADQDTESSIPLASSVLLYEQENFPEGYGEYDAGIDTDGDTDEYDVEIDTDVDTDDDTEPGVAQGRVLDHGMSAIPRPPSLPMLEIPPDEPRNSYYLDNVFDLNLMNLPYMIGWITTLSIGNLAAKVLLDEQFELPMYNISRDRNRYVCGRMGKHKVVIASLPKSVSGLVSAAGIATSLLSTFPNVRIMLMVGLGGGAPSPGHDIRLGDVVVGTPGDGDGGLLQFDFGKFIQTEKLHHTRSSQPPMILKSAINRLKEHFEVEGHDIQKTITMILGSSQRLRKQFGHPDPETDRLYRSDIAHQGVGPCAFNCGTDSSALIPRSGRTNQDCPNVHYGLIASSNQLLKDAKTRDHFVASHNDVLCFDMEAAGLLDNLPCLVIRGICDYADSHKNKEWQAYAAMTSAVFAKNLLQFIPSSELDAEPRIKDAVVDPQTSLGNISEGASSNGRGDE